MLGAGLVLAGGAVLTCAHVLGKEATADTEITVRLLGVTGTPAFPAKVRLGCWVPVAEDGTGDVALLDLAGTGLDRLPGAVLRELPSPRGRQVRAFGFPVPHDNGIVGGGRIAGSGGPGAEWLQIDPRPYAERLRPGFSGAGVVDERSGAVVGIVVTTYRDDESSPAWMIPVRTLVRYVPVLSGWVGEPVACGRWEPSAGMIMIVFGAGADVGGDGARRVVVDVEGKTADEVSRVVRKHSDPHSPSVGLAGIDRAPDPAKVFDDVVVPLVRRGATVVLQFDNEDSPAARVARQRQLDALSNRVDALADGVAELAEREESARRRRDEIRASLLPAPDLPAVPSVAARLELPLSVLRSGVRDQKPERLHSALAHYERVVTEALAAVEEIEQRNDDVRHEHERLRGLLSGYNAKSVQHGHMEDIRLGELYRAARAALEASPCVLSEAAERVGAYVRAVREAVGQQ